MVALVVGRQGIAALYLRFLGGGATTRFRMLSEKRLGFNCVGNGSSVERYVLGARLSYQESRNLGIYESMLGGAGQQMSCSLFVPLQIRL